MTVYTAVPTVNTNDAWSAAQHNTYVKNNFAALFPYSAVGDIAYATGANQLAALAKPSSLSVLTMNSSGVPSWVARKSLGGALHAINTIDFSPSQTFNSGWTAITGATITLVLAVTCTIIVIAEVVGYNGTAGRTIPVRANIDSGYLYDTTNVIFNGGAAVTRNEALPYIYMVGGATAASRVVNLECEADTGSNNFVLQGRMVAAAFAE